MKKILTTLMAGLTTAVLGSAIAFAEPVKVGFVYLTNPGDHGWTYAHEVARQEVNAHFGDKVETSYVENVPEGPDATRVIRELARQGNKIIFTTSFGYMDPTLKVAKEFPDVKFEHITGYKRSSNMATGNIRFYEGRYVPGCGCRHDDQKQQDWLSGVIPDSGSDPGHKCICAGYAFC
jgi:simple sugar transport system substrate-binding protein